LEKKRTFQYLLAADGMRQILWGLFKKIVIADNCTALCGDIFDHYRSMPASALWYGAFLATIWVYADFSGYSDLAIGFSKLLGLEVTRNFNYPFFANNIAQFWRRWHISLTSWMTEYVFTPLTIAFRDLGKAGSILAVLITFTLIGCWHGPKWTFFVYGLANGCLYIPLILRGTMNKKGSRWGMPLTWLLLLFSYILFRCDTLTQALGYYRGLFSASLFSRFPITEKIETLATLTGITIMLFAEWRQQDKEHALQIGFIRSFLVRALIYFGLIAFILTFGPQKNVDFIYLKF
jgi:alginate O-acetyltransferase complex protein AlgI